MSDPIDRRKMIDVVATNPNLSLQIAPRGIIDTLSQMSGRRGPAWLGEGE